MLDTLSNKPLTSVNKVKLVNSIKYEKSNHLLFCVKQTMARKYLPNKRLK